MNPSRASAVLALIGNTPTVPLLFEPEGVTIYAKCEFRNPSPPDASNLLTCQLLSTIEEAILAAGRVDTNPTRQRGHAPR